MKMKSNIWMLIYGVMKWRKSKKIIENNENVGENEENRKYESWRK